MWFTILKLDFGCIFFIALDNKATISTFFAHREDFKEFRNKSVYLVD